MKDFDFLINVKCHYYLKEDYHMINTNLIFTQDQVDNINIIGSFLAMRDNLPEKIDAIILLGSSLISHLEMISTMYHSGKLKKLFIVGGIGHSTKHLYSNIENFLPFKKYLDKRLSESELYYKILCNYYQIPKDVMMVEKYSTNCGDNASSAYKMSLHQSFKFNVTMLIQDPTMQRRSYASFLKEWKDEQTTFINYTPFIPKLGLNSNNHVYFKEPLNPPWTINRYVELVMGEIPRIRDDKNGYGPNGHSYIVHVTIPKTVEKAYQFLAKNLLDDFSQRN